MDDGHGFLVSQDNWQGFRFLGADDAGGERDIHQKHVTIQEEDCAEGLILCGGRKGSLRGKVGDESLYFPGAHVFGVAFVVEEDVAGNPIFVCFFGAGGIMFDADGIGDLIEELFTLSPFGDLRRGRRTLWRR